MLGSALGQRQLLAQRNQARPRRFVTHNACLSCRGDPIDVHARYPGDSLAVNNEKFRRLRSQQSILNSLTPGIVKEIVLSSAASVFACSAVSSTSGGRTFAHAGSFA